MSNISKERNYIVQNIQNWDNDINFLNVNKISTDI